MYHIFDMRSEAQGWRDHCSFDRVLRNYEYRPKHSKCERYCTLTLTYSTAPVPRTSGACFSKVPKLFGLISGDIVLFVSSKLRRLEARNFAVIFIFIPFTTYEKTSFTECAGQSFTNGFSGPKRVRDFRETGPRFQIPFRPLLFIA